MSSTSTSNNSKEQWYCYMMVTNSCANQLKQLGKALAQHQKEKSITESQALSTQPTPKNHFILSGNFEDYKNRYPDVSNVIASTCKLSEEQKTLLRNEETQLEFLLRRCSNFTETCRLNSKMDNEEEEHDENASKTKTKTREMPKRTILGCSKNPLHDMLVYNYYGPSRSSDYPTTSTTGTANMGFNWPNTLSFNEAELSFDFLNKHMQLNSFDSDNEDNSDGDDNGLVDENSRGEFSCNPNSNSLIFASSMTTLKSALKRKPRKRRKPPLQYCLALIIAGFGKNAEKAAKFYELWNEKSRGPIPRAAKGLYLASKMGLEVFGDLSVIFNCGFNFYEIISEDAKFVFKIKEEYRDIFPSCVLNDVEEKETNSNYEEQTDLLSYTIEEKPKSFPVNTITSTTDAKLKAATHKKRKRRSICEYDSDSDYTEHEEYESPKKRRKTVDHSP